MGLTYRQGFIVALICVSMLAIGTMANNDWGNNWHHNNYTNRPKKIVVGGSQGWTFGLNYLDWAFKYGPYFVNDTLVFKYDPPSDNNTHPHSVYLLPDLWSFIKCDFRFARMIANISDGAGDKGFEFVLDKPWTPYFFACGASNGFHCKNGNMKFFVYSIRHWHY